MEKDSNQRKPAYSTGEYAPFGWYSCSSCLSKGRTNPGTVCHCEKENTLPECPECGATVWLFTMDYD